MNRFFYSCLLILNLLLPTLTATHLYVDPNGKDQHSGRSEKEAFRTLHRAQEEARKIIAAGLKEDLSIHCAKGKYLLNKPLLFDLRDSGNKTYKVTYQGPKRDEALISGSKTIGPWKEAGPGLWSADLPLIKGKPLQFREMFFLEKRLTRASASNNKFFIVKAISKTDPKAFHFFSENLKKGLKEGEDYAGAECLIVKRRSVSRVLVEKIDFEKQLIHLQENPEWNIVDEKDEHPRFMLEGLKHMIEKPGEWAIDQKEKKVYYRPVFGDELKWFVGHVPLQKKLIEVQGTSEKAIQNLHFKNLSLSHCTWDNSKKAYIAKAGTQVKQGEQYQLMDAAVSFDYSEHCSWTGGQFKQLGSNALWIRNANHHFKIHRNTFEDICGNALSIGTQSLQDPKHLNQHIIVSENNIKKCGIQYRGAVGIWIGLAKACHIHHNTIQFLTSSAISVGSLESIKKPFKSQHKIESNHISKVMLSIPHGGAIHLYGPHLDMTIENNLIHDIPLTGNYKTAHGLFFDKNASGITARKNLFYNISNDPIRFDHAGENTLEDNAWFLPTNLSGIKFHFTDSSKITLNNNQSMDVRGLLEEKGKKQYSTGVPD